LEGRSLKTRASFSSNRAENDRQPIITTSMILNGFMSEFFKVTGFHNKIFKYPHPHFEQNGKLLYKHVG
jgi:hypothetical protein